MPSAHKHIQHKYPFMLSISLSTVVWLHSNSTVNSVLHSMSQEEVVRIDTIKGEVNIKTSSDSIGKCILALIYSSC